MHMKSWNLLKKSQKNKNGQLSVVDIIVGLFLKNIVTQWSSNAVVPMITFA